MKTSQVVIGLGFGDEGKGMVTNHLCSQSPNPVVIRFSGGHQCGHNVVEDGISHVFANFGSGTLTGVPTYWSKHCTVDPVGILNELSTLIEEVGGIDNMPDVKLMIDHRAMVTTPYDKDYNETQHNRDGHGSCGVGFGATVERNENHFSLSFGDLFNPTVFNLKLQQIKDQYIYNIEEEPYGHFIEAVETLTNYKTYPGQVVHNSTHKGLLGFDKFIFEGSQGLLLDQNYGFFPHVTRSNTGCKNIDDIHSSSYDVYYVTRAYQTRHGAGPMTNVGLPFELQRNEEETNVWNSFQGNFRTSMLDLDLLHYALERDRTDNTKGPNNEEHLVITCMDHLTDYRYTVKGKIVQCKDEHVFARRIGQMLGIPHVYVSHSPDSKLKEI